MLGVVLAFTKRAVFYADFNDLALTAAMFALPALVLAAGSLFTPFSLLVTSRARCSSACSSRWRSRPGGRMAARSGRPRPRGREGRTVVPVHRIAVSAFTAKTRSKRGQGWFVAILTPLLLALVAEHRGLFAITPTARVRAATGKQRK